MSKKMGKFDNSNLNLPQSKRPSKSVKQEITRMSRHETDQKHYLQINGSVLEELILIMIQHIWALEKSLASANDESKEIIQDKLARAKQSVKEVQENTGFEWIQV